MSPQLLIGAYGYPAIFLGTAIEGETVLVVAGFLAHRGYLDLEWVLLMAFLGSLAADQVFFYLGYWRGPAFLKKRPTWQPRAKRVQELLNRHTIPLAVGFRFLYGLRTVVPFAIGMSGLSAGRFLIFNAAGALIWAVVIGGAGYLFGQILEALFGDLKRYELWIVLAIVSSGCTMWLFLRRRPMVKWSHCLYDTSYLLILPLLYPYHTDPGRNRHGRSVQTFWSHHFGTRNPVH